MLVWLFQTGEPLPSDEGNPRPMRAINLANKLVEKGHRVIIWSTAFYHQEKTHRCEKFTKIKISEHLEVYLIPSPGYKKNISLARFYDHCVLAWNLNKQLKHQDLAPDVGFVGYPPIEASYVITNWLKKENIPSLLDIKDKWPEIIIDSIPTYLRFPARVLLFPYYYMAKKAMVYSQGICAHSKGFLKWALVFSNRDRDLNDFIAPLTSPSSKIKADLLQENINWWSEKGIKKNKQFRVIFIGSFSRAFDFDIIFSTLKILLKNKINCEFVLCGSGEKKDELLLKAKKFQNIKVIEWIDEPKIRALAEISDATIAPYKNSSDLQISVPNKVIDSLMLGLPIISPLKGEVQSLIKKYSVGYIYNNSQSLFEKVKIMIANKDLQKEFSVNAKKLYESKFEFNKSYSDLVVHLEKMSIRKISPR